MARRRLPVEDPPSRLALGSRRLVLFALAVALVAVVLIRGGFVETEPGFVAFVGALALAALGVMLALAAFVTIWIYGNPGIGKAVAALFLGAGLLAYPAYIFGSNYSAPMLADISTDTDNPPSFDVIARLRPAGANPVAYAGAEAARKQRDAYPDIVPFAAAGALAETYDGALAVATRSGWRIVDARPPRAGRREGRIEAVALTPLLGLREDVVIRVRAAQDGSVVDVRSASRYGRFDFGGNARRIRRFIEELEEEVGGQPVAAQ